MAEVVDVNSVKELVETMRAGLEWFPVDQLPTLSNVTIEPYSRDERIGWDTHIVCVNGRAWGFTNGPLPLLADQQSAASESDAGSGPQQ